jgi:hypothetical protein
VLTREAGVDKHTFGVPAVFETAGFDPALRLIETDARVPLLVSATSAIVECASGNGLQCFG